MSKRLPSSTAEADVGVTDPAAFLESIHSALPELTQPMSTLSPNSLPLHLGNPDPIATNLATLFAAFDQHLATLPLADKLAEAGRWLAHLADLYCSRADLLLSGWQNKHHPTEPVLGYALDDLFVQSQSLDLADLFEEADPHYYPAERASPTTLVGVIEKEELLAWVDTQETAPEVLQIPEDEDPSRWMQMLRDFWQRQSEPVCWPDLCARVGLPPGALLLAVVLGNYPHYRQEGTGFYENEGFWVSPLVGGGGDKPKC